MTRPELAITPAQLTDLYKLAVGMFAASPGLTYLDAWSQALQAGMTTMQIYEALTKAAEFQALDVGFTPAATNQQFANAFLDQLLDDTVTAPNFAIALNLVLAQLNAGFSRGQVIKNAIETLDAISATDPNFGAAAQRFDNRVEVATFFTEVVGATVTDVNTLRRFISGVTENHDTVIAAEQSQFDGVQFTLRTQAENIVGTAFSDPFFGIIDAANPANSTFTAADVVNGLGSTLDRLSIFVTGGIGALPAAQVFNIEQFFIRDLGVGGTYNFNLYQGETLVANDRSTAPVTLSDIAPGATVRVQGDGSTTLGATTFTMASSAALVTLEIDRVVNAPNITRAQTGPVAVTMTSTGGNNTVGTIDLDTATALTGLTINVRDGDLTAKLAQDYAPGSTLTVIGSNDLDLSGAPLSGNFALVDASAQRAGSTKVVLGGNTTSFVGGVGNDFVAVDRTVLNSTTKLDGSGGINTLRMSDAAALTPATAANIANFQVLRLIDDNDNTNDTFDASLLDGLLTVDIDAMSGGDSVTVNNLNPARAAAITIRGDQANGLVLGATGATTSGLRVAVISFDDGIAAKNTIAVDNITAPTLQFLNLNLADNVTLSSIAGLTALDAMTVKGQGDFSLTTGALALNSTIIHAVETSGAVTIDASAATGSSAGFIGSLTGANTIVGSPQNDGISGGVGNDTITGGNGIDAITLREGDDTVNIEGIVSSVNRDFVFGFTAGTFSPGSGVDRLEVADADVTTRFDATSGTFQIVISAPRSAVTFTTNTANVFELAFDLPGNGGGNDLDNFTDGTGLLGALGQRIAVAADQNSGYIVAYQENKAYLFRAAESSDAGADLTASDITLVGRFNGIAVGAADPSNFIDAV